MATIALGGIGAHTSSGLESDLHNGVEFAPAFVIGAIAVLTNAAAGAVPIGLAIERLVRGDGKRVANAVIAAALGCGFASVLNAWITSNYAPRRLLSELARHLGSGTTPPLHIYLVTEKIRPRLQRPAEPAHLHLGLRRRVRHRHADKR